jgi:hypothetical protein
MNARQKEDVHTVFDGLKGAGELDYVCCWYKKAAEYMQGTNIEAAFVSTNSVSQGLIVSILWPELINNYGIGINFAHQTFKWSNEAKGKASVYCVIIGFGCNDWTEKKLYHYASLTGDPAETRVEKINAYLVDADNVFITSRTRPLCKVPEMNFGNMPADGGHLLFTSEEKDSFLKEEPKAKKYIRPLISAREFLHGEKRYCLWLVDAAPSDMKNCKGIYKRIQEVKKVREQSARPQLAAIPHLFAQITQPEGKSFILIPSTSSENRQYIPMGFFTPRFVSHNSCHIIPDAALYHFGILNSGMHMAWVRSVCGRLGTGYRYSKDIVYNNFPWPEPTQKQKAAIEKYAQSVLDARAKYPDSTLDDLYGVMPKELSKAHQRLDKAVEAAYGVGGNRLTFTNDADRVAHLFYLYETLNSTLHTPLVKKARKSNR